MIPALILWLFKKVILAKKAGTNNRKIPGVFICLLITSNINAQPVLKTYDVIYKGDNVGTVQLHQHTTGDTTRYRMTSDISTRFIFRINVRSVEESTFRNGKLIHSAVNRTVNGNEKVKRETIAGNQVYNVTREGQPGVINNDNISFNVMRLYCTEPYNISKIYSDNHQQFLKISRIASHTYKLHLPDGNHNFYTYNNGLCTKVEVFSSMYDMQMILR